MARQFHDLERGILITGENSSTGIAIIQGTDAPTGLTADQSAAPIGSLYIRSNGQLYQKIANGGAPADFELNGSSSAVVGAWRSEKIVLVTNDVQGAGTRDMVASPFTDDEGTAVPISDFIIGKYIISDADGTPALLEITNKVGDDVTFSVGATPLSQDDTFLCQHYLPDSPDDQEKEAIVNYNGSVIIKISDINWNFADGINMASTYSAVNGTITNADTVNSAIEKLDGNQQDITTLSGEAQGAVDHGTFAGTTIADNRTTKQALQDLESAHEETDQNVDDLITLSGRPENSTDHGTFTGDIISDNTTTNNALQELETELVDTRDNTDDLITLSGRPENSTDHGTMDQGDILSDASTSNALFKETDAELTRQRGKSSGGPITSSTTVDSVLVDSVSAAKWLVTIEDVATPSRKVHLEIFAGHNGHAAGDATTVDDTVFAKLKLGSTFNYTVSVTLTGATTAQAMNLVVSSGEASGVNVYAKRTEVLF